MNEILEFLQSIDDESLEVIITRVLLRTGIPPNIKGYRYLREALIMTIENRVAVELITKYIYPDVAHKYHTTPQKVERAIRHAIEVAWERNKSKLISECFGTHSLTENQRPTNSEFIATMADRIKGYI